LIEKTTKGKINQITVRKKPIIQSMTINPPKSSTTFPHISN